MNPIDSKWHNSDAWVFLALYFAANKGSARLADVIHSADAINKAIPSTDELNGAVNRLIAAELITCESSAFRVTLAGRDVIEKSTQRRSDVFRQWKKLYSLLKRIPLPKPTEIVYPIKESDQEAAYTEYSKRFRHYAFDEMRKWIGRQGRQRSSGD